GSNPAALTATASGPAWSGHRPRKPRNAGSNPASLTDSERRANWVMATVSKAVEPKGLEGSTPSLSAARALGRAAHAPDSHSGKAGSTPAGHSRGSANGRPASFEVACEGSTPSPRTL